MKYILSLLICMMLIPSASFADYTDKIPMTYQGMEGAFIEEGTLTLMIQDLDSYQKLKHSIVPDLKLKCDKYKLRLDIAKENLKVTEKISDKYEESFFQSEELRLKETQYLRDKLESKEWFRSPALYFTLGIIVGGAIAVGMAYGISHGEDL